MFAVPVLFIYRTNTNIYTYEHIPILFKVYLPKQKPIYRYTLMSHFQLAFWPGQFNETDLFQSAITNNFYFIL